MKKPQSDIEIALIRLTVILTFLGLLMCLSTTLPDYFYRQLIQSPYTSFLKQLLAAGIGFVLLLIAKAQSPQFYKKFAITFYILNILLLLFVLFLPSSVANEYNQMVRRSIPLFGFTFQPSELAKVSIVFFIARLLSNRKTPVRTKELFKWLGLMMIPSVLIIIEPNFSAAALLFIIGSVALFYGGIPIWQYFICIFPILGSGALIVLISGQGSRILSRFSNFLGIFTHGGGDQYQLENSLRTIAQGRYFGNGFLKSTQKFQNLPFNSTDFVFSVICEEFGNIMAVCIVILFFLLFVTSNRYLSRQKTILVQYWLQDSDHIFFYKLCFMSALPLDWSLPQGFHCLLSA